MPRGPHKWRDLMEPVTKARVALALNATDLSVLRAVLSFVPSDMLSLERPETHICFAGNLAIADRIGSSGDSTVNRSLRRLEAAGLIERRQSANRKRYAQRNRAGVILRASGIDLAPLILYRSDLAEMAARAEREREDLDHLREDCKALTLDLSLAVDTGMLPDPGPDLTALLDEARRALRRKPASVPMATLRARLSLALETIPDTGAPIKHPPAIEDSPAPDESDDLSDTDAQIERHIDSRYELSDPRQDSPITFREITEAFPTFIGYIDEKDDIDDIQKTSDALARGLGDTDAPWRECKRQLGFPIAFILLGFLLENHPRIRNVGGYLRTLTREIGDGHLRPGSLLKRAKPRRYKSAPVCLASELSPRGYRAGGQTIPGVP